MLILTSLSIRGKGEVVSLAQLAQERNLPRAFAAQISKKLVKGKLIGSKEGRGGGYYLLREPAKISLVEILRVIEGKLKTVLCTCEPGKCRAEAVCLQKNFMLRLSNEIEESLNRYTLADLVK